MTTYEFGDVVLVRVPTSENLTLHARPAMVIEPPVSKRNMRCQDTMTVIPITPDPIVDCGSMLVAKGSFESARMGLITSAYLNAVRPQITPLDFVKLRIGRCPIRLLEDFVAMYRDAPVDY